MAQTTGSKKRTKKPAAGARSGSTAQRRLKAAAGRRRAGVKRTSEFSEDVLRSLEDGQRAAIEAVHSFVDRVDRTLPALPHEDGPSRRQEIIDSALEMTDRLVHAQYDFIREVVHSTGKSLSRPAAAKSSRAAKSSAAAKSSSAAKRSKAAKSSRPAKRSGAKKK